MSLQIKYCKSIGSGLCAHFSLAIIKLVKPGQVFKKIVYVLTILVGSFFRELGFYTSFLCVGLNFPLHIDKVLFSYSGPSGIFSFGKKKTI